MRSQINLINKIFMQNDFKEYTIYDGVTPKAVTSSTDASPSVVTKASHGLTTGDRIVIFGHATNIAINGVWDVVVLNSSTFTLKDINTGVAVNGSGAGAGSGGVFCTAPKIPLIEDFRNAVLQIATASSFNGTLKIVGSLGKTNGSCPNFGATVAATNPWGYLESVDLSDGSSIAGATGVASAGTDIYKNLEVNINTQKFLTVIPTAWSAGAFTVKILLTNNK